MLRLTDQNSLKNIHFTSDQFSSNFFLLSLLFRLAADFALSMFLRWFIYSNSVLNSLLIWRNISIFEKKRLFPVFIVVFVFFSLVSKDKFGTKLNITWTIAPFFLSPTSKPKKLNFVKCRFISICFVHCSSGDERWMIDDGHRK